MKQAIMVVAGVVTLIAGEGIDSGASWESWIVQGGAISILGFAVVWFMTRIIPAMQADHKAMLKMHQEERKELMDMHRTDMNSVWERINHREVVAHDDSEKLNVTLVSMTAHCKETVAHFGAKNGGREVG